MLQTAKEVLERIPGVRDLPGLRGDSGAHGAEVRPGLTAPRTSFNQRITEHRRTAFCTLDFDDVHRVRDTFGVTVNDVVIAVCAGALRRWLGARRELPTDPLLALVPLSVRDEHTGRHRGTGADSRVAVIVTALATHEADPARRIRLIASAAAEARRSLDAVPASLLSDVSAFASPAVASLAARVVSSTRIANIANPPFNLVITNVPGPQQPLYCAGARQVATYAIPAISDGVGLSISAMSYDGHVHVGAVSCRELMPDLWGLVRMMPDALGELRALTAGPGTASRSGKSRSPTTGRSRAKGEPHGRTA